MTLAVNSIHDLGKAIYSLAMTAQLAYMCVGPYAIEIHNVHLWYGSVKHQLTAMCSPVSLNRVDVHIWLFAGNVL